jgi:hypothetical protein
LRSSIKADRTSGIELISIENLLIVFATRAAGRLIARRGDDPNCSSVGSGAGRTSGIGRTSGAGLTSGARRASGAGRQFVSRFGNSEA